MSTTTYSVAHVSEIPSPSEPSEGGSDWKPVRHHFGIEAFGTNAAVARAAGERILPEHAEGEGGHEELYFVAQGRATFTVGGETIDAPAGTFVFVRDPSTTRAAVAEAEGTILLAFGGWPGKPFQVSEWERQWTGGT
jgi:quercetin dioxygenase-like cupin family protein